jgi:hypothetical protein
VSKFKKIDLSKVKTIKASARKTKAEIAQMGRPIDPGASFSDFVNSLPGYLKSSELRDVAADIARARRDGKARIWMMGAHPIKVGLSRILIDLIENGFISHLALNGAGAIHDLEMAFFGRTSEEVADGLADGTFGMVDETPKLFFEATSQAISDRLGLGEGVGKFIAVRKPEYAAYSILAACYLHDIPATVHVGIGTDTICQHPGFDGAAIGKLSHDDFLVFSESISRLTGGVILNIGSAVVLPEVFLKALTVARNITGRVDNFTAVNFDMIQHYRPNVNVITRPVAESGKGYSITGHHELMIPLLAAAIKEKYTVIAGRK